MRGDAKRRRDLEIHHTIVISFQFKEIEKDGDIVIIHELHQWVRQIRLETNILCYSVEAGADQ